jgi:hypothetical protein
VNALDCRVKRFCKHILSFEAPSTSHPCISRPKCNNIIFNEIMVLNASYVCLMHSHLVENHLIWIVKDGPLISEVVLS